MSSDFYSAAISVAKSAGEIIKTGFHRKKKVSCKTSFSDLVTETDREVERHVVDALKAKFPDHKFIGEETSSETNEKLCLTDDPTWILDPVDGTCNFVHSIPHTCISLALLRNKRTVVGVIYNPLTDELYRAAEGDGAFCNDEKISVSGEETLEKSVIICDVWSSTDPRKIECTMKNMETLIDKIQGFRAFGSGALNMCYVARGICEAYFEYGIHCWDMAAADLIVREAGGVFLDPSGVDFDVMKRRVLCCSSQELARQLVKLLVHVDYESEGVVA